MAPFSLQVYPALKVAVFVAGGILLGRSFADERALLASLVAFSFIILFAASFLRPQLVSHSVLLLIPILLCFLLGSLGIALDSDQSHTPPDSLLGGEILLKGTVLEPPRRQGEKLRFITESEFLQRDSSWFIFHSKVLVSMKVPEQASAPEYGSIVVLRGTLFRPKAARNPGEFDQRRYYLANGIPWMFVTVERGGYVEIGSGEGLWFMRELVLPARRYVLSEIDRAIGGQEGEYLKGVLIGERGGLSAEVREAFTAAGVAHILAVSGGNVAVVVAFVFLGAELLRFPRRSRPIAACFGVLFYMLLVGYQPSVVRATIMAMVLLLGRLAEEKPNPINSLGVSALIILAFDARQLFDVGFQLSFLAVFSIIHLYPLADGLLNRMLPGRGLLSRSFLWLLRVCTVSLVATLGTLPLTTTYFGRVSIIGVLANVVVIPASGVSLLLGFVALPLSVVSPWMADVYHGLNHLILRLTLDLTLMAGNLPFASVDVLRFNPIDALPFYAILFLVFHLSNMKTIRKLCLIVLGALNLWIYYPRDASTAAAEKLRVSFIDVGQGDAALAEFPDGRTLLIDAGPNMSGFDSGKRIVVPFLKRRGIARIDLVVVTHPHNDHLGGIPAVLEEFEVAHVVDCGRSAESSVFERYQALVVAEGCPQSPVRAGERIDGFPAARVYVLAPERESGDAGDINNSSVVLKLVYGSVSFLFTGDAEEESEKRMVNRYEDFLKSSLLKVGHHGSSTSSTDSFRNLIDPDIAVVSVGTPNRYRHPSTEILGRFAGQQATILRTDQEGAIVFETDGNTIERIEWRDDAAF